MLKSLKATLFCKDYRKPQVERKVNTFRTGGKIARKIEYIKSDPLLIKETYMVLFLKEYAPNKYYIMGGPQGRFCIQNNKVYSVGEIYSDASSTTKELHTNGVPTTQFYKEVTDG